MTNHRLAVLYEHPDWFKPLFAELNRRSIIKVPLYAEELWYDPAVRSFPYPLVLNRMRPSSYLRGHAQGIFFCRDFLPYLEDVGVNDRTSGEARASAGESGSRQGLWEWRVSGLAVVTGRATPHSGHRSSPSDGRTL